VKRSKLLAAGLALPALALLTAMFALPAWELLLQSTNSVTGGPLEQYERFGRAAYLGVMRTTVVLAGVAAIVCLLVGTPVAYLLVHRPKRLGVRLVLGAVVICYLMSSLVRAFAWFLTFVAQGPVARGVRGAGVEVDSLLFNPVVVVVGMVHYLLPTYVLLAYAGLRRLPTGLVAAAESMGARHAVALRTVYLPLAWPALLNATTIAFVIGTGFYVVPALLGGPGETMLSQLIGQQLQTFGDLPFASAAGIVLLVVVLAVVGVSRLVNRLVVGKRSWA